MKTLEQLYEEILASDTLKQAFAKAVQEKSLESFLKENDCQSTLDELKEFLIAKQTQNGELSATEMDAVAGGANWSEALLSIFTGGLGCAIRAISSAAKDKTTGKDGRLLCDEGGHGSKFTRF